MTEVPKKVRVPDLAAMKRRGDRIVMLTAYDSTMARIFDSLLESGTAALSKRRR
jgi:ketopantoate hydroxymethyltransferase